MEMDRPAATPAATPHTPAPAPAPAPAPKAPAPKAPNAAPAPAPKAPAPAPKAPVVAAVLKPKSKKVGTKRTLTAASVFAAEEEEEEERPARRLVPIEYTPEELAAASRAPDPTPAPTRATGDASASERAKSAAAAIEANIRRVAAESKADASAPPPAQTKEAIFAREVNWSAYSDPVGGARAATASWTRRRVAQLLGEEEPALVELVLEKTDERLSADAMVEALEPMLDAEAEPFVLDLWRVILKETRGGDA